MGKIHSIETFGTVDGPGIRFVVFVQGCPMRCLFCHNPDTWLLNLGKEVSVDELLFEIKKYRHYYGTTGGVTVSGGEPLMQIEFVTKLFKALKEENIHTCLDTSGVTFIDTVETKKKFDELMSVTDLVMLDIKHITDENHQKLTGHPNTNILRFARYLDEIRKPVWIRHVLVPTINDDEESLKKLRKFIDTLNNVENIEVLPYHTYGIEKYKKLGIDYKLKGIEPPTKEQVELANKILKG